VFRSQFVPNRVLAVVSEGEERENATRLIPLLEGKGASEGKATAYVCENRVCMLPTSDPAEFSRQLRLVKPLAPS
jgi:hypothetical protein